MKQQKKFPLLLGSLCSLVYFASYLTRGNMGAVISEICRARSFTAAQAAPIVTLGFWSYGIGQLLWGYLGRRLPSKGLMLTGLFLSGAVTLAVPLGRTVPVLAGLLFLHGGIICLLGGLTAGILAPLWRKFQSKTPAPEGTGVM